MAGPLDHLSLLSRLLEVARAGALFPDARRVMEWVAMLRTPWRGRTTPKLELDAASGFPTARSLQRLLERQRLARGFFAAHRTRPPRSSDQFNVALAAAELWAPGIEAKVMSAEKANSRLLVVHDRFDAGGCLVRFSVQLQQRGAKHVKVQQGTACTCTSPFGNAVELACGGDATEAALKLSGLEGIEVHEVVRGELGPCVTAQAGAFEPLKPRGEDGVLSLVLERVGADVTAEHCADAWLPADPHAEKRAARGWKRARERKLICTPSYEAALKPLGAGSRMLIRSR